MQLQLTALSKRFGRVLAVDRADLSIEPGRVLALLGENGAGKSTLMKLLYGIHRPDSGTIRIDRQPVRIDSPRTAMALGIGMVFQQFSLIPALTVRENLALASPAPPWWVGRRARRMKSLDQRLLALAPGVDPEARVASLPVGQLQLVELAKVAVRDARCVILDEPSAVLTPAEATRLWTQIRRLADDGVAVVLITHKLPDVRACADDLVVMRAGRVVARTRVDAADVHQVIEWMVGQAPPAVRTAGGPAPQAPVRLAIRHASAGRARDIGLQVQAGEIVGVAGVSGGGQADLADAITGQRPLTAGEILLDGERLRAPRLAVQPTPRLGCIPAEVLRNAVAPGLSLAVNLALKGWATLPFWVDEAALLQSARTLLARFAVRPADPSAAAGALSGGNLQKLVIARELSAQPAAVLACYPTMGLDVNASAQVYDTLFGLAQQGCAVLWISEDLDDLLQHAHRIAVMFDGRIVTVRDAATTSAFEIGAWMTGQAAGAPAAARPSPALA